jgi:prophage regulatory protein
VVAATAKGQIKTMSYGRLKKASTTWLRLDGGHLTPRPVGVLSRSLALPVDQWRRPIGVLVKDHSSRGLSAAAAVDSAPSGKLLSLPDVLQRVPISRARFYQLIARGTFPRQVKVGARSAWIEHEVDRWVDSLAARRDAA